MTRFQLHVSNWNDCQRCELKDQRQQVVHYRGKLPCDVLFIGEAPGDSENVIGQPFVGPAGILLDQIIRESQTVQVSRIGFVNLVGCFPREGKKVGNHAPPDPCIKSCSPRLKELVEMAKPKYIVRVGSLSTKWVDKLKTFLGAEKMGHVDIVHPSAILQASFAQRPLMTRQSVVRLRDVFDKLTETVNPF